VRIRVDVEVPDGKDMCRSCPFCRTDTLWPFCVLFEGQYLRIKAGTNNALKHEQCLNATRVEE